MNNDVWRESLWVMALSFAPLAALAFLGLAWKLALWVTSRRRRRSCSHRYLEPVFVSRGEGRWVVGESARCASCGAKVKFDFGQRLKLVQTKKEGE